MSNGVFRGPKRLPSFESKYKIMNREKLIIRKKAFVCYVNLFTPAPFRFLNTSPHISRTYTWLLQRWGNCNRSDVISGCRAVLGVTDRHGEGFQTGRCSCPAQRSMTISLHWTRHTFADVAARCISHRRGPRKQVFRHNCFRCEQQLVGGPWRTGSRWVSVTGAAWVHHHPVAGDEVEMMATSDSACCWNERANLDQAAADDERRRRRTGRTRYLDTNRHVQSVL